MYGLKLGVELNKKGNRYNHSYNLIKATISNHFLISMFKKNFMWLGAGYSKVFE